MNCSLFYTLTCLLLLITTAQQLALVHSKSKHNNGPPINVTRQLIFPNFNPSNNPTILQDIRLLGSAKLSPNHTLQIPDQSQGPDLKHQAGRALYSSPVRLYDPQSNTPASFRTTFSFQFHNFTSTNSTNGDQTSSTNGGGGSGLAFVIVPDEFTVGRPGPWLAMINDACDDEYKAVAVEFDTRFNPEFGDPSDNHVGINLGTMVSTEAINASNVGVSLNDGSVHRAWISYDGPSRAIDIRLGSDGGDYPSKPVFSGPLDIATFLNEYMFIGFSASTGNATQIHSVLSWNFTSTSQAFLRVPSSKTCESKIIVDGTGELTRTKTPSSFLIFMAVVVLALVVLLSLYYNGRRKADASLENAVVLPEKKRRPTPPNKPRKFTFAELSAATASFHEVEILGSDSRGVYYRGKLSNGCHVAIKRFAPEFLSSVGSDRRRLMKEVSDVSKVRHPNLAPIRGWYQDRREAMVVYDFFANGSLDKWLFGVGVLPWTRRFKVLRDVAEGLAFLHSKQLAHKNLKPSSVLLDVSFRAVVGDFGFVLCSAESRRFEAAVSQSADVFEFGLFVLEVVAGKRRTESTNCGDQMGLLEFGWRLHEIGEKVKLVDKRMGSVVSSEQVVRVVEIGLLCTLNENRGRPSMVEVVEFLSSERPVPELPLSRPVSLFPYSSMNAGLCTGYSCAAFK